ncbi:MAG: GNAT family N-acetyltransferase, partial [Planctomycetota bacterium]
MAEATFVPYNDKTHRTDFYEINHEYLTGLDNILSTKYGINLNPSGTVKEYLDTVFQKFTEIHPPEGIIYILELEGKMNGMGVLRKQDEGVGEIKRMYIREEYQGFGFGKELYRLLENKARE